MASVVYPDHNDEFGNRYRRGFGTEAGDYRLMGQLTIDGLAFFNSNVRMNADLILSDTSYIEMVTADIYNFSDALIEMNKKYTGPAAIPTAGLSIYRGGGGYQDAYLHFTEDPTRVTAEWRVGLNTDMLRVARIEDGVATARSAMCWETTALGMKLIPNTSVLLNATEIASSIPYEGSNLGLNPDMIALRCYSAGPVLRSEMDLGFTTATFDTHLFGYMATIASDRVIRFVLGATEYARVKFAFDDDILLGTDADGAALVHTDKATLRVECPSMSFSATPGTDEMIITPAMVTLNADLDLGVYGIITDTIETISLKYNLPVGFNPIPVVGGWGGSITYGGITYTEATSLSGPCMQYEVQIDYTIIAPGDPTEQTTLVVPININGNLNKGRNIYGVVQLLVAGVVTQFSGLPPNDMWVQPPFQIDPVFLTYPGNLNGYHLLSINIAKKPGTWRIIVTVVTTP